jgi:hypothetical protein
VSVWAHDCADLQSALFRGSVLADALSRMMPLIQKPNVRSTRKKLIEK